MKTRHLTIESLFGYSTANPTSPAPYLRLKGHWLRSCGLLPGDQVEVVPGSGGLTIRKIKSNQRR